MAVDDSVQACQDTDTLVLPNYSFWPLRIPIAHWQLRHYVSSSEPDIIYYASCQDVYSLNTVTNTRSHIAVLPFNSRCTASGYGYICVGGEDGQFAAVKVHSAWSSLAAEVDALLPLDFALSDEAPRLPHEAPSTLGAAGARPLGRPAARVKEERLGTDITNSVSMHQLYNDEDGLEEDIVAVVTNNDRTVRIYSLTHEVEVAVLDLPFPMNHASISPDGQLLVAVGDFHQAYFYERVKSPATTSKSSSSRGPVASKWEILSIVQLHCPSTIMASPYFTSAWSPSSSLCAVGSENGYVTVFDADMLRYSDMDESPIVQIVASTKPADSYGPGGIRSMCFSPQPWDLLIWAEDHGIVCVADVRSGLLHRQAVELRSSGPNVNRREVLDVPNDSDELRELNQEADIIRRYRRTLDPEVSTSAINITTDYLEVSLERRRLQRLAGITTSDEDSHGLTAQERQILEALRTTRQRQEARERSNVPRSIQYSPTVFSGNEPWRPFSPPSTDFPGLRTERSNQTTTLPPLGSLRDFLRERNLDPDRPLFQPRRQASVVLPNDPASDSPSLSLSSSALALPLSADPWRTIEAAMAHSPLPDSSLRVRSPAEVILDPPSADFRRHRQALRLRDRQRNLREMQLLGSYENNMLRRAGTRAHGDPSWGLRTAGLAMSQDGRRLFVGTEEGMFEFAINMRERKSFPAVQAR